MKRLHTAAVALATVCAFAGAASAQGLPFPFNNLSGQPSVPTPANIAGKTISDAAPSGALVLNASMTRNEIANAINNTNNSSVVVFQAGVYRVGEINVTRAVTLRAAPNAVVWFDGTTPVNSGWTSAGNGRWYVTGSQYIKPVVTNDAFNQGLLHPMASDSTQAFINSVPQVQVSALSEVTAGRFFVDRSNNRVYVHSGASAPTGVALSLHNYAFDMQASATVRGLNFRSFSTGSGSGAANALGIRANNSRVANCVFAWNGMSGLAVTASNVTVEGNDFIANGLRGMTAGNASGFDNITVRGNYFAYNNIEGNSPNWSSAAFKTVHTSNVRTYDNYVAYNRTHGLWYDETIVDSSIFRNYVRDCRSQDNVGKIGIMDEISGRNTVAFNIVRDCNEGVLVWSSSSNHTYNNILINNAGAITVRDQLRTPGITAAKAPFQGLNYRTTNTRVANNIMFSNVGSWMIHAGASNASATQLGNSTLDSSQRMAIMNSNVYRRLPNSTTPTHALYWRADGATSVAQYLTLGAFRTYITSVNQGQYEANGAAYNSDPNNSNSQVFVDPSIQDFRGKAAMLNGVTSLPTQVRSLMKDQTPVASGYALPGGTGLASATITGLGAAPNNGIYRGAVRP